LFFYFLIINQLSAYVYPYSNVGKQGCKLNIIPHPLQRDNSDRNHPCNLTMQVHKKHVRP